MNLPKFKYLSPPDLKEALTAIKEFNGRIAVFAGGAELVPHFKLRLKSPDYLLSLKNIADLRTLRYDRDTGFTLGAMCSLRNLAAHSDVKSKMAALAQGAEKVASSQIRNKTTIGSNSD
jgi:CO/xanthine dehydrogenase FAD-binding subunit